MLYIVRKIKFCEKLLIRHFTIWKTGKQLPKAHIHTLILCATPNGHSTARVSLECDLCLLCFNVICAMKVNVVSK